MDRTKHVAIVSKTALFHPDFDAGKPGIRQFVKIPAGYVHSDFSVKWVEHSGQMWAIFQFETWPSVGMKEPLN